MRKVGDILKKRRLERNFTLDDVERRTKIRKKFLEAIEKGDYGIFPSSTYLRGFIKNYSDYLNLPTSEILAIFRREFDQKEQFRIIPKGLTDDKNSSFIKFTPNKISVMAVVAFLVLFFGYLVRGYLSVTGVPNLTVDSPQAGEKITQEKVLVTGKTDPDAKLTINNQEVIIGTTGDFSQEIVVGKNTTSINVIAENKQGKKAIVERIVEVQLNDTD